MEDNPETGRPKRVLNRYVYDLGSCTFCDLCVSTCPFDAIHWSNSFEHALFTKERLVMQLNQPGSSLKPKPAAPKPAPAAAAAPETKPAAAPATEAKSAPAAPEAAETPKTEKPEPTPEKE